jgi:hypothetical protein
MGISTTTNRVVFAGNGSSTVFPFAYEFFSQSDLKVFLYSSSAINAQTLNTHYTISGSPNLQGVYTQGGSVVTTCAVPTGSLVVLTRDPSLVQNYSLLQNGSINSVALVQQLDYLTLLIQRLQDKASRAMLLQDGSAQQFDPQIPFVLAASSVLITNSTATGWTQGPQADQIFGAQSAAISAAASRVAAAASAASAAVSDASAQSSAVSAGNNAISAASAALSASMSASIVGSSAFWGSVAQSAAVSATNQSVLAASAAVSAGNLVTLANSAAVSASNQAVLSGSAAVSATNQAVLAAASALSASSAVGAISLPLIVASGGTGTQGGAANSLVIWNGSSSLLTSGPSPSPGVLFGTAATGGVVSGTPSFHDNLLVNGGFDWWQRINGSSLVVANSSVAYGPDRWYVQNALGTNGVITVSRVNGQLGNSQYGCQVQITTTPTAAQTNGTELWQTIENSTTMTRFMQSAAVMSVMIKSLGQVNQVGITLFTNPAETKCASWNSTLAAETLVTVTSAAFTQIATTSINPVSYLAGSSGVVGMRVRITGVVTGSTHAVNNGFIAEQAGLYAGAGNLFPSWRRGGLSIEGELRACQRYYEKSYDANITPGNSATLGGNWVQASPGGVTAGGGWWNIASVNFKVQKRTNPTMSLWDLSGIPNKWSYIEFSNSKENYNVAATTGTSRLSTAGWQINIICAASAAIEMAHWAAEAEI